MILDVLRKHFSRVSRLHLRNHKFYNPFYKRVCEGNDVNEFVPFGKPDNQSEEFQFLKLRFCNCNWHRKTVILGNVYRSPAASNSTEKFNNLFDKILQKLNKNRCSNKIKYIVGDQDII